MITPHSDPSKGFDPSDPIYVTQCISPSHQGLPLIIPWKFKWPVGITLLVFSILAYLATNTWNQGNSHLLPLFSFETQIPFLPFSVWIYVSELLLILVTYRLNRCRVSLNQQSYAFVSLVLISNLIFLIFPTTYPRATLNLPNTTHWLDQATSFLLQKLWSVDQPVNCFPSLHVSLAYLFAFTFLDDRKQYFPGMFLWATLISISTLTTKQHYFLDVLSGFALGLVVYWMFNRRLRFRIKNLPQGVLE